LIYKMLGRHRKRERAVRPETKLPGNECHE
jgi:hypothetical protein